MGQTLTHGVYLPDEGERNCYDGLASNWSILDGAVGTVAAHTAALAGKAPAVHTHTKSDITDFPVYGTTAGTICEGNDSRLSDARTPVAHTHTKSDVTDLFNSANTWSGDNTYSKTVAIERSTDTGNFLALKNTVAELGSTPASATPVTIAFRDKDNDNLGYMGVYYDTDGSNHFRLYVRNKYTSGAPSTTGSYDYAFFGLRLNADKSKEGIIKASFRPYDNNTHDLGSSSYQWNNLYAKRVNTQSVNGVNPGALSLPNYSDVVNLDTTNWSKAGNMIVYTPTFDGWLQITIPNDDDADGVKSNMISILDSGTSPIAGFSVSNILGPRLYFLYPVRASRVYWLYVKSYSGTITVARLVKCLGNV